jgi:hypothetical protein
VKKVDSSVAAKKKAAAAEALAKKKAAEKKAAAAASKAVVPSAAATDNPVSHDTNSSGDSDAVSTMETAGVRNASNTFDPTASLVPATSVFAGLIAGGFGSVFLLRRFRTNNSVVNDSTMEQ